MGLYLTLMHLNPLAPDVLKDLRDPHALHGRIMRAFPVVLDPEEKARAYLGVLHRLESDRRSGRLLLYVQSGIMPDWSFLPQQYLLDVELANPSVKAVGRIYEGIAAEKVLRFRLRVNPTRKIETKSGPDGTRHNGRRVPLNGVDAQVAWLTRKGTECGFELLRATVAGAGAGEMVRSHSTGRTFQGVLFEGQLVVRDPERFRLALTKGIGPGKAYGFGLLSIGPG